MTYSIDNKNSLNLIKQINSKWIKLGEIFLIPFINIHTLYVKTLKQKNSNLILLPRGCGKTDFLAEIGRQNPKYVTILADKMFESELIKQNKEFFNNKALIHFDFITAMFGLTQKQRQQLIGFFTSLLSDNRYHRQNQNLLIENVKCICIFGMAKENFDLHREEMFESTFLDRLTMIHKQLTRIEKKEILQFRDISENKKINLKLKYRKKPINIKIDRKQFGEQIIKLAMELDFYDVMSYTRSQDYIINFLKANAYYNDRIIVNENDLLLYQKLHLIHIDNKDISKLHKLQHILKDNPKLTYEGIIKSTGWSRPTVWKYMKKIKELNS